jgi:OmpA-OmpF porin, OOP family
MKRSKAVLAIAGISAALAFSGGAAAQPSLSSAYIGGTIGQSEYKDGCAGLGSCDKKDTAWRILGGYQVNRYFAAELGYHNLGEASAAAGATEGKAWELVGVGAYPFANQFSVYGKLGVYRGELKGPSGKENNSDLTYGAGLQYDLLKNVGLRGEWQRYNKMGGGNVAETDVDVLSAGVVYRFQ